MGEASFSVESQCFLTNCQSIQEMLAPESTSAEELTTFNMCEGVINCMGFTYICLRLIQVQGDMLLERENSTSK